jgi:prophage regulatory protein
MNNLPDCVLLRLKQIIGDLRSRQSSPIPISKSAWWAGVKSGRFPKPSGALGSNTSTWTVGDIRKLSRNLKAEGGEHKKAGAGPWPDDEVDQRTA